MARAQRPEGLNSDTETSFGWFSAELAGSGGTVGWNPDLGGSGWVRNQAQGGLSPWTCSVLDGECSPTPQSFTEEIFRDLPRSI